MVRHVMVHVNRNEYLFINVAVYSREGSASRHTRIYYISPAILCLVLVWFMKGCMSIVLVWKSRRERLAWIFV